MIGMFDSGIGGLTVLRALRQVAPQVDVVYFGDTENAPYGEKSQREISECISMALRRLHAEGTTNIINACNSASVLALAHPVDLLRLNIFSVVEMVGPTVQALVPLKKRIVLLGTRATINARLYQEAFRERGVIIETVAIPELAGCVERGVSADVMRPLIERAVREAVEKKAEIISLSCTHYPFVRGLFEEAIQSGGGDASLFDPAEFVATEALRRFGNKGEGRLRFLLSQDSAVFRNYVHALFGDMPHTIEEAGSIYWSLKTI